MHCCTRRRHDAPMHTRVHTGCKLTTMSPRCRVRSGLCHLAGSSPGSCARPLNAVTADGAANSQRGQCREGPDAARDRAAQLIDVQVSARAAVGARSARAANSQDVQRREGPNAAWDSAAQLIGVQLPARDVFRARSARAANLHAGQRREEPDAARDRAAQLIEGQEPARAVLERAVRGPRTHSSVNPVRNPMLFGIVPLS